MKITKDTSETFAVCAWKQLTWDSSGHCPVICKSHFVINSACDTSLTHPTWFFCTKKPLKTWRNDVPNGAVATRETC